MKNDYFVQPEKVARGQLPEDKNLIKHCTNILGRLVIVPRLALTARRAAGGTAGAAATWGYLGRPLASLPCTGRHLFDLRRELQMCPQICSPWSLGSTPSKPTFIASAYLRALRAPRAWSRAGACAA